MGLAGPEIRVVGGAHGVLVDADKGGFTGSLCERSHQGADRLGAAMLAGLGSGLFEDAENAVAQVVELAAEPILPIRTPWLCTKMPTALSGALRRCGVALP